MTVFSCISRRRSPNWVAKRALLLCSSQTFHCAAAVPLAPPSSSHLVQPLFPPDIRFTYSRSRFFSPFSGEWLRFTGPLFLSSPAYKLSQSATPLYSHGNFGFLKPDLSLILLHKRCRQFPLTLDFRTKKVREQPEPVTRELAREKEIARRAVGAAPLEELWNLPNMISLSRLASGPLLGAMIVNEWYLTSFIGLVVSGITDWLDGFVARRMGIDSVIGSYLDPLADKVLIGCVALGMVEKGLLPPWLVLLVVLRDAGLVGGAIYKRASSLGWQWKDWSEFVNVGGSRPEKVEPLFVSKVNTVFQLVLVASALLQPVFGTEETQLYLSYLSWLVGATTVTSTVAYGAQHIQKRLPSAAFGARH